jgi:hypothetical protein
MSPYLKMLQNRQLLDEQIEQARLAELPAVIAGIRETLERYGLTITHVARSPDAGMAYAQLPLVAPKYPDSSTWPRRLQARLQMLVTLAEKIRLRDQPAVISSLRETMTLYKLKATDIEPAPTVRHRASPGDYGLAARAHSGPLKKPATGGVVNGDVPPDGEHLFSNARLIGAAPPALARKTAGKRTRRPQYASFAGR